MERSELILTAQHTVLVVIDMQEVFLKPIKVRERLEHNINYLIEVASILSIPSIITAQNQERLGSVIPSISSKAQCAPLNKLCFSAMQSEPFVSQLASYGRSQVLITGVEAHICVLQTALDLLKAGYRVFIPYDAVGSRTKEDWKFALRRLERAGVIITSVESAVYEWLESAGTDQFRKVLPLLKQRYQAEQE